jgi:RecJ-like exonuclease
VDYHRDYKNLGRQGPPTISVGMWPMGEPLSIRAAYDALMARRLEDGTKTKVCYNCRGKGKVNGEECTACQGSGSVPAASAETRQEWVT